MMRDYVAITGESPQFCMTTYVPCTATTVQDELARDDLSSCHNHLTLITAEQMGGAALHDITIARMPTRTERKILRLPRGVPVIDLLRINIGRDGTPIQGTRLVSRGDTSSISYDILIG